MRSFEVPTVEYDRYTNRQLLTIPLVMLTVALVILAGGWVLFGTPVQLGMDFTGGTELTVETTDGEAAVADAFSQEPESVQSVEGDLEGEGERYIVQFPPTDEAFEEQHGEDAQHGDVLAEEAESDLTAVDGDTVVQSSSTISAGFGEQAQQTAILGLAAAFVGMSVLTFVLFRTFVPSVAIVASAFSDMMLPLAFMNLTDIPLTLGTVAGLLMIVGYSVDSDILLNNQVLRQSGDFYTSVHRAMRTGVTMTVTSMAAMLVMATAAWLFGIELLMHIGLILFIGLAADLMNTYLLNVSLLRWYKFEGVGR